MVERKNFSCCLNQNTLLCLNGLSLGYISEDLSFFIQKYFHRSLLRFIKTSLKRGFIEIHSSFKGSLRDRTRTSYYPGSERNTRTHLSRRSTHFYFYPITGVAPTTPTTPNLFNSTPFTNRDTVDPYV